MAKKTENRGGVRIAGKGKKIGPPFQLEGGKRTNIYLDEPTLKALLKIDPKISRAIRILVRRQFSFPPSFD